MASFGDLDFALEMRDAIKDIASKIVREQVPSTRIGRVFSFDAPAQTAQVLFPGGEAPADLVPVRFAMDKIPQRSMDVSFESSGYQADADVVRVSGTPGALYITDFVTGTPGNLYVDNSIEVQSKLFQDTFTVTTAGPQRFKLSHTPIDGTETLTWNGTIQSADTWMRTGRYLIISNAAVGDTFIFSYSYLPGDDTVPVGELEAFKPTYIGTTSATGPITQLAIPAGAQENDLFILSMASANGSVFSTDRRNYDAHANTAKRFIVWGYLDDVQDALAVAVSGSTAYSQVVVYRGGVVIDYQLASLTADGPMPTITDSVYAHAVTAATSDAGTAIVTDTLGDWKPRASGLAGGGLASASFFDWETPTDTRNNTSVGSWDLPTPGFAYIAILKTEKLTETNPIPKRQLVPPVDLGPLNVSLAANAASLANLNNVVLPGLVSADSVITANLAATNTLLGSVKTDTDLLKNTTVPNLNTNLVNANAQITASQSNITALQGKFPVQTADIGAGVITNAKIASGAVGAGQIANGAVGAGQIANGAVGTLALAAGAVTSTQIASGAVGAGQIAVGAVGTTALANGAVTSTQIASGAVGAGQIAASAITSAAIADGAVLTAKIGAGQVTSTTILDGAISTPKLAVGSVIADRIAAGAVTANKLSVIMGGGNLLSGSSFEDSTNNSGWNIQTAATITNSATVAYRGVRSLKVDVTNAGTFRGTILSVGALQPGWYTASVWVYPTSALNLRIFLYDGVIAPQTTYTLTANTWQRMIVSTNVASTNGWSIGVDTNTTAQTGTFYLDAAQLEQGEVATAYSPKADEILPGTIVANMVSANAITATAIAAGAVTSTSMTANSIAGDRIAANTLDAAKIIAGSITATQIAANAITANKLSVIVGGGNLLVDSSFEATPATVPFYGGGTPVGWVYNNQGAVLTYSFPATAVVYGSKVCQVQSNGAGANYSGFRQIIPLLPNTKYTMSAWVYRPSTSAITGGSGDGNKIISIWDANAAGAQCAQTWTDLPTNVWTRVTAAITTGAAPGAAGGHICLNPPVGGPGFFDAVQFELGDVVTAYSPKADEILPGTVVATMVAANAITAGAIAAGAVTSASMTANSIAGDRIAANTLDAAKIIAGSITSDRIAANAITANKLAVIIGGGNLLTNSSFEDIVAGIDSRWMFTLGGRTPSISTADSYQGTRCIQSTPATNGDTRLAVFPTMTAAAQDVLTVSIHVKPISGTENPVNMTIVNGGVDVCPSPAAHTVSATKATLVANNWWRLSATFTFTGAGNFRPFVLNTNVTTANNSAMRVDAAQIEQGEVATAYVPKADEILPGTIVAAMVSAGAITATAIAAGAVTSASMTANSIAGDRIAANTLDAAKIIAGSITADRIAANAITANKLQIIVGGGNLVSNASFQNPLNGLTDWLFNGTVLVVNNWSHSGTNSAQVTTDSSVVYRDITGLVAGRTYMTSVWAYKSSTACQFVIHDTTGANLSQVAHPGAVGSVVRLVLPYVANATGAVRIHGYGTGYFDDFQVEEGEVATAYAPKTDEILPGTIVAPMIQAGAVTSVSMTANSIAGDRIAANTLDAGKIVAGSITTDRFTANTIDGSIVTANTLNAAKIIAGTITGDRIAANTISAKQLFIGDPENHVIDFAGDANRAAYPNTTGFTWNYSPEANGAWRLYIDANAFGTNDRDFLLGEKFEVLPGDQFRFYCEAYRYNETNYPVYFNLIGYDQLGNYVSRIGLPVAIALPANGWNAITGDVTIPAGVTRVQAEMYVPGGAHTSVWFIRLATIRRKYGGNLIVDGSITADKIAANSITAEKLTIGSVGPDLILNGGFEDAGYWTYNPNALRIAGAAHSGGYGLQMSDYGAPGVTSPDFPVAAGDTLALTCYARQVATGGGTYPGAYIYLRVQWKDSTGAIINPYADAPGAYGLGTPWTLITGVVTAPANAVRAFLQVYNYNGGNTGSLLQVDDITIRKGIISVQIADGAVLAPKIGAGEVIAGKIGAGAVTAITVAADAISANNIQADAITANKIQFGAITGDKISATAIDGKTITGAVLQTAYPGSERIVVRNDGSGGIIESYSGVGGNEVPGVFNPSASGLFPTLTIASGKNDTNTRRPQITMQAWGAGSYYGSADKGGSLGLFADSISISAGGGGSISINGPFTTANEALQIVSPFTGNAARRQVGGLVILTLNIDRSSGFSSGYVKCANLVTTGANPPGTIIGAPHTFVGSTIGYQYYVDIYGGVYVRMSAATSVTMSDTLVWFV